MIGRRVDAGPTEAKPATKPPAKTFPFKLDQWQQQAIGLIDSGQSLMVAAHTSAGKTSVAEYAIAAALQDQRKVIYTSPIKALSNQKFRELQLEFGESQVGLKTGDLTLNPEAPCLVMTTEILRNMLYRDAVEMEEVEWIVFDEIHYMRDRERGVVWEEAIILCPKTIKLVFLSATLSNAEQFADWISKLHGARCEVVQTMVEMRCVVAVAKLCQNRPIPLHHYVFIKGEGEGIYLVSDPSTRFNEKNFEMAVTRAEAVNDKAKNIGIQRLMFMLVQQNYHPAILFSFRRRECEANAMMLGNLTLNTPDEEEAVQTVFDNALESLSEEDRNLPQALNLLPILKRGIGVHHGGMLPILKEIVEILFQESLVKVLCATETFALGVNMPAKTVIFTSLDKFDGETRRPISSSEYIQMSGRAGRRGKDPFGLSIMMIDQNQSKDLIESLVDVHTDPLISQFRLTYNSILNMSRSELHNPELLLKNSFLVYLDEIQQQRSVLDVQRLSLESEQIKKMMTEKDCNRFDSIDQYFRFKKAITDSQQVIEGYVHDPESSIPFIQPGRVVYIGSMGAPESDDKLDYGWGIVIGCQKIFAPSVYGVDVLVNCRVTGDEADAIEVRPSCSNEAHVVRFFMDTITRVSSARMFLPDDLLPSNSRRTLMTRLKQIILSGQIPDLLPVQDMKMSPEKESDYLKNQKNLENAISILSSLPAPEEFEMALFESHLRILSEIDALNSTITTNSLVQFKIELKNRLRLLRRLQYIDSDGLILQKGQIACEIDSLDELVSTELIVDGVFQDLDPAKTAALVCCLQLDQENRGPAVPKEISTQFATLKTIARHVAELAVECDMPVNVEEYVNQFLGSMAAIVLDWCHGVSFTELCAKYKTVFEGSIIRNLRRLQEVLMQLAEGARSIGNAALQEQFEQARKLIHRGIPFAGSLYL